MYITFFAVLGILITSTIILKDKRMLIIELGWLAPLLCTRALQDVFGTDIPASSWLVSAIAIATHPVALNSIAIALLGLLLFRYVLGRSHTA